MRRTTTMGHSSPLVGAHRTGRCALRRRGWRAFHAGVSVRARSSPGNFVISMLQTTAPCDAPSGASAVDSRSPVIGAAALMGEDLDAHHIGRQAVDQREREALETILA